MVAEAQSRLWQRGRGNGLGFVELEIRGAVFPAIGHGSTVTSHAPKKVMRNDRLRPVREGFVANDFGRNPVAPIAQPIARPSV
jgi:hypothetical protein